MEHLQKLMDLFAVDFKQTKPSSELDGGKLCCAPAGQSCAAIYREGIMLEPIQL